MQEFLIDWYDGPVSGLIKSGDLQWYLGCMVYFDPDGRERIFQLIEVEENWAMEVQNDISPETYEEISARMRMKFSHYTGSLLLVKGNGFLEKDIEIRILENADLKCYFPGVEAVLYQDDPSRWLEYFRD